MPDTPEPIEPISLDEICHETFPEVVNDLMEKSDTKKSGRRLADEIGKPRAVVNRWITGKNPIPKGQHAEVCTYIAESLAPLDSEAAFQRLIRAYWCDDMIRSKVKRL